MEHVLAQIRDGLRDIRDDLKEVREDLKDIRKELKSDLDKTNGRVDNLESFKSRVLGGAAAVSTGVSVFWAYLKGN